MKKLYIMFLFIFSSQLKAQKIDTKIDNWRYWKEKAELKIIPFNPNVESEPATRKSSIIKSKMINENSPDILLIDQNNISQSENSVFVNPTDNRIILNSNNSVSNGSVQGANALFSFDDGTTWSGGVSGAGGNNSGDPAVVIGNNGENYIGFISSTGQGISSTTNNGTTWTIKEISSTNSGLLDKNHLWIDNSNSSSNQGNLYSAWTPLGTNGNNNNQIEISKSSNGGINWSAPISISNAVNAGSHNQGVNIQTGPNGEVYAVWSIYDSWPSTEKALGFSKSTNGGVTFNTATRIHNNIKGIRWQPNSSLTNYHGKNMRTNSFPSMAVDISGGPNNGNIYIVWTNVGVPGTNSGNDVSIYIISSTNGGNTWSSPTRINQDPIGNVQYFPWITCDPITGNLSVIFYDDRDTNNSDVEVWVANSLDGGITWDDSRVSDVSFTPAPIPGLAGGYMGDYLGIAARGGKVYPVWSDNRSGQTLAYTSPYTLENTCPENLIVTTNVTSNIDNQQASNTINASNIIFSTSEANYNAGNSILLTNGFNAKTGSKFKAFIEECSTQSRSENLNYLKTSKPKMTEYFKESSNLIDVSIFPNPTSSIFNVDFQTSRVKNFEVKLYSLSRGLLYKNTFLQKETNNFQIDISEFTKGIYIVNITDIDSGKVYFGKIIKN